MKKASLFFIALIMYAVTSIAQTENHRSYSKNKWNANLINKEIPQINILKNGKKGNLNSKKGNAKNIVWICDTITSFDTLNTRAQRAINTCDTNGNILTKLLQIYANNEWVNSYQYSYSYDANGNVLIRLYEKWENIYRVTNTIDVNGNIIFGIGENWYSDTDTWGNYAKATMTYDANGNLLTRLNQSWNYYGWENYIKDTFVYDDNGNVLVKITEVWENDSWNNETRITNTYNSSNKITSRLSESAYYSGPYQNSGRNTYTYDANGNLIVLLTESWQSNSWANLSKTTYTVDANGDVISLIIENWENSVWVFGSKDSYEYDANGNSIKGKTEHVINSFWKPYYWYFGLPYYLNGIYDNYSNFYYTYRFEANFKPFTNTDNLIEYSFKASIFPNPATNQLNIELPQTSKESNVTIYNTNGQQVFSAQLFSENTQINISNFPVGLYLVKVISSYGVYTSKIIKK